MEKNEEIRRELDFLASNIDKMDQQSKSFYRDMVTKLVKQNFRDVELQRIIEKLREIDFAEPEAILAMFEFKCKDENDMI